MRRGGEEEAGLPEQVPGQLQTLLPPSLGGLESSLLLSLGNL